MIGVLVPVADAAYLHGVPARTVYRWVAEDRCRRFRVAGLTHVDLVEVEWLAELRRSGFLDSPKRSWQTAVSG